MNPKLILYTTSLILIIILFSQGKQNVSYHPNNNTDYIHYEIDDISYTDSCRIFTALDGEEFSVYVHNKKTIFDIRFSVMYGAVWKKATYPLINMQIPSKEITMKNPVWGIIFYVTNPENDVEYSFSTWINYEEALKCYVPKKKKEKYYFNIDNYSN